MKFSLRIGPCWSWCMKYCCFTPLSFFLLKQQAILAYWPDDNEPLVWIILILSDSTITWDLEYIGHRHCYKWSTESECCVHIIGLHNSSGKPAHYITYYLHLRTTKSLSLGKWISFVVFSRRWPNTDSGNTPETNAARLSNGSVARSGQTFTGGHCPDFQGGRSLALQLPDLSRHWYVHDGEKFFSETDINLTHITFYQ